MKKLTILLVDDHAVLRDGLKALVNAQPDMEVVSEADNGRLACQKAKEACPDVVVMDVSMPDLNGIQATEMLKREQPDVKVLVLSAYKEKGYLDQLLRVGATGYVLKLSAADTLIEGIRKVAADEVYLDPEMVDKLADKYVRKQVLKGETSRRELTDREEEVMRLIAQGYSNKEIGVRLNISVKTVESHKSNLMQKLELRSRTEIVRYAVCQGWLQDS